MYYSVQSMGEDAQCIGLAFATGTVPNQKVEGHFNPNFFSSCQNLNSYINLHKPHHFEFHFYEFSRTCKPIRLFQEKWNMK